METLSEYRLRRSKEFELQNKNKYKVGILCDDCKVELLKDDFNVVLNSNPPQYQVYCPQCGKIFYIF